MQEQLCPPIVVKTGFDLNQAISDLRFYYGLARHKGIAFYVEIWSERGLIVPPQEKPNASQRSRESCGATEPNPALLPSQTG